MYLKCIVDLRTQNMTICDQGRKHRISKELLNITIHSAVAPVAPSESLRALSGPAHTDDGYTPDPMPENLADQLEYHTRIHEPKSSQHTKRQLKLSDKWKECIPSAFKAVVEGESMKGDVVCMNCGAPANVRCRQCGPYDFFCSDCGVSFHSRWNYHHYPEMWKV